MIDKKGLHVLQRLWIKLSVPREENAIHEGATQIIQANTYTHTF